MERRSKGLEAFGVLGIASDELSFSIPLGECTPREMVLSMYSEISMDLQKMLVGAGKASVSKSVGNRVRVVVTMSHCDDVHRLIKVVGKCFRYCLRMEIPLCLYGMKAEMMERVGGIMRDTGASICIEMGGKVEAFVCGKREACLNARMRMLVMIEEMFGRPAGVRSMAVAVERIVESGGRVFYRSRINSEECIVSGGGACGAKQQEQVAERFVLDTQKTVHLLLYKGAEVEDILAGTQSYMATREVCADYTEVILKGFDLYEVRRARDRINVLYNTVMKMAMQTMRYPGGGDAIVFRVQDGSFVAVGEKEALLRMAEESGGDVEAEMDIDTETVEFLCGKKNGKITRIMKDVCCEIAVHRKGGCSRVHLVVSGSADTFRAALGMIEDEFPEELTFYIDERHHKRIIGYGGKNIQRIMKKHGVYIKFMNERERKRSGYRDNVVIKTPRKNGGNLTSMKSDVMRLVGGLEDDVRAVETRVSLHDFYDLGYPKYRLLYDEAVVEGKEAQVSCYLKGCEHSVVAGPHLVFKLRGGQQWFVKAAEALPLERVSTVHWLQSIERMSVFSWLFGGGYYSSLFNSKGKRPEDEAGAHPMQAGLLSRK